MAINIKNYANALSAFYQEVGNWKFAKDTKSEKINENIKALKEKARLLQIELKELPPSMVRPQLVEHINKVLAL